VSRKNSRGSVAHSIDLLSFETLCVLHKFTTRIFAKPDAKR
jgi:hypothetical protein